MVSKFTHIYFYHFKFLLNNTGKKGNNGKTEPGLGPKIVRELADFTPSTCVVDNYFTDYKLMARRKFLGTVKKSRK